MITLHDEKKGEYLGLSTDEKPRVIRNNLLLLELDTNKIYYSNNGEWIELGDDSSDASVTIKNESGISLAEHYFGYAESIEAALGGSITYVDAIPVGSSVTLTLPAGYIISAGNSTLSISADGEIEEQMYQDTVPYWVVNGDGTLTVSGQPQ